MSAPDVSIALFAGSEGHRLHGAVLSAERAARHARAVGRTVDCCIWLHHATFETRDWLDTVLANNWRVAGTADSLGAARRQAAASPGRHVAFLDGPDLWSENWLTAGLAAAEAAARPAAWHPETVIGFAADFESIDGYRLIAQPDTAAGYDPAALLDGNAWPTGPLVPREILDAVPWPDEDAARGWSCIDWWWACNVAGLGHPHRTVPGTLHYQRHDEAGRAFSPFAAQDGRIGPTPLARSLAGRGAR